MEKVAKHEQLDEKALIAKLIEGDAAAFDYVVGRYHSIMLSVARAIIGEAFADEVVQEAWVSAIKALPRFEGRASLKTWLLQITSNGAKTRLRRESRQLSLDDGWQAEPDEKFDKRGHRIDDVLPWNMETPDALLENDQLRQVIENTFQKLPPHQRAVLTMADIEGLEMTEICNILDISSSNARVLLHRARTTLHHSIEKYQES
ncbi:MAG: sigma-70 family RNA polymerase sigma factor [Methylophaga sp.]|jgi:RNA polymerase sigma-70 factor (ECF subfamily)|nr:sigma-70 family RNA polymerase sigma factor [Methylophaga sp.]MEC9313624.1 sigma-70 family RNA polymerase sigma factor [Pseudomonadota bacterium]MED5510607.1 sigma-70 family RNA polymerase sigma factor [Pseudomonadota bacterium]